MHKPVTITRLLLNHIKLIFASRQPSFEDVNLPEIPKALTQRGHSVFIRHLDCGSCNGCELELNALTNPIYDIEQYGICFEASPRHADVLAMTGPFTRNLEEAALLTFEAMPEPKIIVVGDCANDGGIFKDSYAVKARPKKLEEAIVIRIRGCPPTPEEILKGLAELDKVDEYL